MNLKQKLDEFAQSLINKASQNATPLIESIDAFKAVTAYYAAQQKNCKGQTDEDPDPSGFSFTDEVVHGSGNKTVSTRRSS